MAYYIQRFIFLTVNTINIHKKTIVVFIEKIFSFVKSIIKYSYLLIIVDKNVITSVILFSIKFIEKILWKLREFWNMLN
ncbi:MAG TPA: hypothetical protein DDW17_08790 [Deltaproteobacteria bacterium]|nr:hypothetical protein [Deltaproteobacteria bacterium]